MHFKSLSSSFDGHTCEIFFPRKFLKNIFDENVHDKVLCEMYTVHIKVSKLA